MDMEILFPRGKKANAIYEGFTIRTDQLKDNGGKHSNYFHLWPDALSHKIPRLFVNRYDSHFSLLPSF
jgi:hypothetical protein